MRTTKSGQMPDNLATESDQVAMQQEMKAVMLAEQIAVSSSIEQQIALLLTLFMSFSRTMLVCGIMEVLKRRFWMDTQAELQSRFLSAMGDFYQMFHGDDGTEHEDERAPVESLPELIKVVMRVMGRWENDPVHQDTRAFRGFSKKLSLETIDASQTTEVWRKMVDPSKLPVETKELMVKAQSCLSKGTGRFGFTVNISKLGKVLNCSWHKADNLWQSAVKIIKSTAQYERRTVDESEHIRQATE
jgi:hypothetical protein